ncbi:MAG: 3-phosphoglycerate dehydrogenase [Clostridiales bacterium]|nr:3-phosphoglycerate dehydrogenase [Clostridiales bacterium]MDY4061202.1 3-phosphoglycerate dehydrogenase [Anaerovoracaceae bacterium]
MYRIGTLNKISKIGLEHFTNLYEIVDDIDTANGIIVRSQDMHNMEFPESLVAIARAGAGVNNIPLEKCADKGIAVFNTPGANANAVKELVIASVIMSARNLYDSINWACSLSTDISSSVEKGKGQFAGHEIAGKTLGVIGLGAIGVKVANAASNLEMKVVGYDPYLGVRAAHDMYPCIEILPNMGDLLSVCDYITVHIPANPENKNMFNKEIFDQCKDGVVILNFSRNSLVNEEDLLDAINSGKIKQYVTDFPTDGIMCKPGVLCVPHLGASTAEAEDNCAVMAADEIMNFIENGNISNSVNLPNASLGPMKEGEARVAVITKGISNPVDMAIKMCENNIITGATGGLKGVYGYALISSSEPFTRVRAAEGVVKVRVMQDL